jgi:hypothetical protein
MPPGMEGVSSSYHENGFYGRPPEVPTQGCKRMLGMGGESGRQAAAGSIHVDECFEVESRDHLSVGDCAQVCHRLPCLELQVDANRWLSVNVVSSLCNYQFEPAADATKSLCEDRSTLGRSAASRNHGIVYG